MYDLHSHILPGVDDGPERMEDSVEMARVAVEQGTRIILATPHRADVTKKHSVSHIQALVEQLNGKLQSEGIALRVELGMENHLDLNLPDDLERGRALRMSESRYALIELPFFGYPNYVEEVLFRVQVQGIVPVLAHPERLEVFQERRDLLFDFIERGMLSQVTAGSVVGLFGGSTKRVTHRMIRDGLVHIIASDTHYPHGPRSPLITAGLEATARIVGKELAEAMVVDTPKAILDDRPIQLQPPHRVDGARRWWRFWEA
mgnify:CR=1 FL=1